MQETTQFSLVSVTVSGGNFKGFLLKAQNADSSKNRNDGVGTFTLPDTTKFQFMCGQGKKVSLHIFALITVCLLFR